MCFCFVKIGSFCPAVFWGRAISGCYNCRVIIVWYFLVAAPSLRVLLFFIQLSIILSLTLFVLRLSCHVRFFFFFFFCEKRFELVPQKNEVVTTSVLKRMLLTFPWSLVLCIVRCFYSSFTLNLVSLNSIFFGTALKKKCFVESLNFCSFLPSNIIKPRMYDFTI